MRTLASLLATAALVGGVTIASAQSGSPTAPSGPMAGGSSPSTATQGVGGTQRIETTGQARQKGAKAAPKSQRPRDQEAPLRRRDRGPGVPARRDAEFLLRISKSRTRAPRRPRCGADDGRNIPQAEKPRPFAGLVGCHSQARASTAQGPAHSCQ